MKKKGFTLIELLAVIVILAIIALIIVPVVANIIESARFGAAKDSVLEYVHAANQYGALSLAGVSDDGLNINGTLESGVNDSELEKIKYSGTKFDYIYMEFDESNNVTSGKFCINGYSLDYNNNEVTKGMGYCETLDPGLYAEDGTLIKTWDELVALGMDIEKDYTSSTMRTDASNPTLVFKNNGLKGNLILPNTITKIGDYAFVAGMGMNYNALTGVKISESVETIGLAAFDYQRELTSVDFSKATNLISIGSSSFTNNSLKSVSITNSPNLTIVKTSAFDENQIEKVRINADSYIIEDYVFYRNKISDLKLLGKVTAIGQEAFNDNQLSDSQGFIYGKDENGNNTTTIVSYGGANRNNVTIPNGVIAIGKNAFRGLSLTGKITLPESVSTIENNAFEDNSLTDYEFKGVISSFGNATFNGNLVEGEKGFIMAQDANGNPTTTIVSYAGVSNRDVTMPSGITEIAAHAFENIHFKNGNSGTSLTVPSTVMKVGNNGLSIRGNAVDSKAKLYIQGKSSEADFTELDSNWVSGRMVEVIYQP
ncbi:MAG: leucine-rich repeat domain-containing protein [Bacilli bacterium]|nr:leucine-rich repeat domain-containing protein [Bacilli bacterium]